MAKPIPKTPSTKDVKAAKSVLRTVDKQQRNALRSSYKQVVKSIDKLRKAKDKLDAVLEKKINVLKSQQEAANTKFDLELGRLSKLRDEAGAKAGIVAPLATTVRTGNSKKKVVVKSKAKAPDDTVDVTKKPAVKAPSKTTRTKV